MLGEFGNENAAGELQVRRPFWKFMLQAINIIMHCKERQCEVFNGNYVA